MSELKCCKRCGAFYSCTNKGECCPECESFDPIDVVCMAIDEPKKGMAESRNLLDDEVDDDTSFLFEDDEDDEEDIDSFDDDSDDEWD
ncbi:MAG: hypothetical protein JSW61_09595 [Candidatus Thorarchaeota archaeon]|nr:MAG: hypothetical protein JSW61_09595 [Candidatus Thorarchaeota archaeon]